MGDKEPFYVQILANELERRKNVNKKYSLRTFATRIGIDPTYLSKCLTMKQTMSFDVAEKVISYLKLPPNQRVDFLRSIAEYQSCVNLYKHDPKATSCDSSN